MIISNDLGYGSIKVNVEGEEKKFPSVLAPAEHRREAGRGRLPENRAKPSCRRRGIPAEATQRMRSRMAFV